MKCGVVVFPGSNCDHDAFHVLGTVLGQEVVRLWHKDDSLQGAEFIVLPGGFSYGDYLRSGSLASLSPIMAAVKRHADAGGLVLGICNGFQILLESGLLPGAMRKNRGIRFECRDVFLRVERTDLLYTREYAEGQVIRVPIAHSEGNYEDTEESLDRLEAARQVAFRYVSPAGELDDAHNINGSARAIAGVVNEGGNVLGMMPHPERCSEPFLGNDDGLGVFAGVVAQSAAALGVAQ